MVTLAVGEQTWAYARVLGDQAVVVVLNSGAAPADLEVPTAAAGWTGDLSIEDRLGAVPAHVQGGRLRVFLGPRSAVVFVTSH
jgi:hypothetical protein